MMHDDVEVDIDDEEDKAWIPLALAGSVVTGFVLFCIIFYFTGNWGAGVSVFGLIVAITFCYALYCDREKHPDE